MAFLGRAWFLKIGLLSLVLLRVLDDYSAGN